jgi:hypothetical protein
MRPSTIPTLILLSTPNRAILLRSRLLRYTQHNISSRLTNSSHRINCMRYRRSTNLMRRARMAMIARYLLTRFRGKMSNRILMNWSMSSSSKTHMVWLHRLTNRILIARRRSTLQELGRVRSIMLPRCSQRLHS